MHQPLVSVIMPVYNREKYVREAIESILNQTLSNLELLIVDDASTDNTRAVINSFKDIRITLFSLKENKGVSAAYNKGLRNARGLYIARMDSDDISMPDRLEKQLAYLENNPEFSVCGSWVKFMNSENIIKHKESHDEIITEMLIKCPLSMGAVMFKKEDLINYPLDENLRHGEDYELWSRVGWKVKMYNIQEPLLSYRTHNEQLSGSNKNNQINLDIDLKFALFKKLDYSLLKFPDDIIVKFLTLNKPITLQDFSIYLNWLKRLSQLNRIKKVFPQKELEITLKKIKNDLIFKIYYTNAIMGVDKEWRTKALLHLDLQDSLELFRKKIKMYFKIKKSII